MALTRTVAGTTVTFEPEDVERVVKDILPDPLHDHFVVIAGRRFPPKQVVALLMQLDRADFTTHHARRLLQRAGFTVGRLSRADADADAEGESPMGRIEREASLLRPHRGQWVALRGERVLVATSRPEEAVAWLARHGEDADALFRVPSREAELEAAEWR